MSDPVRLLVFVLASAVAALALLFFAPVFLLLYGWPLAWAWTSVLSSWVFVDCLHGYFEDQPTRASPPGLYRVAWRARLTGHEGRGTGAMPHWQVLAICSDLDRSSPLLFHWPEPAE